MILGTVLLAASLCATAAAETLAPNQVAAIDSLFRPFDRLDSPGYVVGVVREGRLIFAKGYGRANLDEDVPLTPQTVFHLASLSKQFTSAAIALLMLDGKLSMDTPVARYFPEVAHFGADLRIKHLIYFTSGLPDYTTLPRANGEPWFSDYYFTTDEAIATVLRAPKLEFLPGTRWEYSNVDYMMLARIVERCSGMSLAEFLRQRVFLPLGMLHTDVNDDTTLVVPHRAIGYVDRGDPKVRAVLLGAGIKLRAGTGYAQMLRVSPHYGGSGVFSSVEDLARWDANFYDPKVGGPRFVELMLRRERFAHPKDNDALGLVHGTMFGRPTIWFSGSDLDTNTFFVRFPDEKLTVICLSNLSLGNSEEKAQQVAAIVLGVSPSSTPSKR